MKKIHMINEFKNSTLFENSMDAILVTSTDGSIIAANPPTCEIFGYTEAELIRMDRNAVVDSTDTRLTELLASRHKNGKVRGELNLVKKDGSIFPAELSSSVFKDGNGKSLTSMIIRDISERKSSEERIKQSEQKFRNVFENSVVGKTIVDLKGKIVCNPAFTKILGY